MNYIRNHYVITGSLFWWFIAFLTASASIFWGIALLPYAIPLLIVGVVIITAQTLGAKNRSKLRNLVLHELPTNPNASIEHIKSSTGITKGDIRAIIIDLKGSGLFKDTFSKKAGQMEHESIPEEPVGSKEIILYCPNCGSPVSNESDQNCSYCGAEL